MLLGGAFTLLFSGFTTGSVPPTPATIYARSILENSPAMTPSTMTPHRSPRLGLLTSLFEGRSY